MFSFRSVERNFSHFPSKPFFNYPWLLRKLLSNHGLLDYIQFVKPIRCEKRNTHYDLLYRRVMTVNIGVINPDNHETNHGTAFEPENDHPTTLFQKIMFLRCGSGSPPDAVGKSSHIG
jgi:hypothetical protein